MIIQINKKVCACLNNKVVYMYQIKVPECPDDEGIGMYRRAAFHYTIQVPE